MIHTQNMKNSTNLTFNKAVVQYTEFKEKPYADLTQLVQNKIHTNIIVVRQPKGPSHVRDPTSTFTTVPAPDYPTLPNSA